MVLAKVRNAKVSAGQPVKNVRLSYKEASTVTFHFLLRANFTVDSVIARANSQGGTAKAQTGTQETQTSRNTIQRAYFDMCL